jgi:hypothetical protein
MEIKGIRKNNIAYRMRRGLCSFPRDLYWNIYLIKNKMLVEKTEIRGWIIMGCGWASFCI